MQILKDLRAVEGEKDVSRGYIRGSLVTVSAFLMRQVFAFGASMGILPVRYAGICSVEISRGHVRGSLVMVSAFLMRQVFACGASHRGFCR